LSLAMLSLGAGGLGPPGHACLLDNAVLRQCCPWTCCPSNCCPLAASFSPPFCLCIGLPSLRALPVDLVASDFILVLWPGVPWSLAARSGRRGPVGRRRGFLRAAVIEHSRKALASQAPTSFVFIFFRSHCGDSEMTEPLYRCRRFNVPHPPTGPGLATAVAADQSAC